MEFLSPLKPDVSPNCSVLPPSGHHVHGTQVSHVWFRIEKTENRRTYIPSPCSLYCFYVTVMVTWLKDWMNEWIRERSEVTQKNQSCHCVIISKWFKICPFTSDYSSCLLSAEDQWFLVLKGDVDGWLNCNKFHILKLKWTNAAWDEATKLPWRQAAALL